jgi:hypothetical protein
MNKFSKAGTFFYSSFVVRKATSFLFKELTYVLNWLNLVYFASPVPSRMFLEKITGDEEQKINM